MPRKKTKKSNIFCLEGDWNDNLKHKSSILPALELLELNNSIKTIYRTCSTFEEFVTRVKTVTGNNNIYRGYDILYFAFHGRKNKIIIGQNDFTLEQIGDAFKGKLKDKIVHFGSCKTLAIDKKQAEIFLENTGAIAISGYGKNVDFISSTVVDVLYFEMCQKYVDLGAIEENMKNHYGDLCEKLNFKINYIAKK